MKRTYNEIESEWAIKKEFDNGVSITSPKAKKVVYDLGLKIGGAIVTYWVGRAIGEVFEYIPYINEAATHAVDFISGIDIKGNLGELTALLFGAAGFAKSGIRLNKETLEFEGARLMPFVEKDE
jgi:hypothetical protein